jgi:hypothetical protein
MRYRRAVEKIRILAEACQDFSKRYPGDEPFILEAYVFGDVLRGTDPLEDVEVALVLNLPPDEVIWGGTPHGTPWLADHASYWDYDWRRENRGGGRYPEHELWEAVQGYLDLLDASQQ